MKGKILLVVGLGVGYVLGARAGRERYDEISRAFGRFWNDPRVQKQVNQAEEFVKDKGPDVAEFISDGAKKVAAQVRGSKDSPTAAKSSATRPTTRSSTRSSTTKK